MTPQERTGLFLNGNYKLTDNVEVYASVMHNKTSSAFQLAPAVYTSAGGVVISADSYYNPFGVDFRKGGSQFGARLASLGNRRGAFGTSTDQVSTGLKGSFGVWNDQQWNWEVGMDYGHISQSTTTSGLPNTNITNQATGPSFLGEDGVVHCGTPDAVIAGCVPFNPFNLDDPNTIAQLQKAGAPASSGFFSQEKVWRADLNGGLFELPAGTMQLAVGASYRKEYTHSVVDTSLTINPETGVCVLGSQCSSPLQGGYNVKEVYAELFVPIIKDVPFVHALNLTIGDRYSKYNNFGNTNNGKIALEWRPIEDLLLRGTVSEVFRAPTVSDLFAAAASDAPKLSNDPCDHYTGNPVNPACVNVPTDGSFVNSDVASGLQISGIASGSQFAGFNLGPETGKSFDWGIVYDPHFIDGLSVSADYWRIYLNDNITGVGAQAVLDLCSNGQLAYCPLIHRFPNAPAAGQIEFINEPTGNLGRVDVKGVDFALNLPSAGVLVRPLQRRPERDLPREVQSLDRTGHAREHRVQLRGSLHGLRFGRGRFVPGRGRWRVLVPALACAELGCLAAGFVRRFVAYALRRPLPHGFAVGVAGHVPGGYVLLRRLLHDPRPVHRLRRDRVQRHPVWLQPGSVEHAFRRRCEQRCRQAAAVPVREQHAQCEHRSVGLRSARPLLLGSRDGQVLRPVLVILRAARFPRGPFLLCGGRIGAVSIPR